MRGATTLLLGSGLGGAEALAAGAEALALQAVSASRKARAARRIRGILRAVPESRVLHHPQMVRVSGPLPVTVAPGSALKAVARRAVCAWVSSAKTARTQDWAPASQAT